MSSGVTVELTRSEDVVVEDGEVESETETRRMSRREFLLGERPSGLIGFERLGGVGRVLGAGRDLGEVSEVVSKPVKR